MNVPCVWSVSLNHLTPLKQTSSFFTKSRHINRHLYYCTRAAAVVEDCEIDNTCDICLYSCDIDSNLVSLTALVERLQIHYL